MGAQPQNSRGFEPDTYSQLRHSVPLDPEDEEDPLVLEYAAPRRENDHRDEPEGFTAVSGNQRFPAGTQTGFRFEPARWEPVELKEESNLVFYEGEEYSAHSVDIDEIQEQPREPQRRAAAAAEHGPAPGETSWASAPVQFLWTFLLRVLGPYFEIDSDDVMLRLSRALIPLQPLLAEKMSTGAFTSRLRKLWGRLRAAPNSESAETDDTSAVQEDHKPYSNKADLYGPFWIATTLILLFSMSSSISSLIRRAWLGQSVVIQVQGPIWKRSDVIGVTISAAVIYGYEILAATLFWALRRFLFRSQGPAPVWATSACVFGYALSPLIPAAVLALFPHRLFQIVVLLVASGISSSFLMRNLLIEPLAGEATTGDATTSSTATVQWPWNRQVLIPALIMAVFQAGLAIWCIFFLAL
ncbi:hypothetical protein F1559_004628 [Cyanidiococcus yangmingshanensis]|uniref:Yip1 domain-containing protein n=1 Tax=Cyanidiococcus yangmingshanensis TaxID=2690220 RepID=A0A7J7IMD9_9RHOD|nr:hypothetical protein F1559_004628 [Cyanidiococcus yangmingshanensis]